MKTINTTKIGFLSAALGLSLAGSAMAQSEPRVFINGERFRTEAQPLVQDNRVLVPMRAIFERLGANVEFNRADQSIVARRGRTDVRMALGSNRASVDNARVRLDVPATALSGRTYVPLRFVSEALGATVDFNSLRNEVSIRERGNRGNRPGDLMEEGRDEDRDVLRDQRIRRRERLRDDRRDDRRDYSNR
jgi:hypothetical protein